MFYEVEIFKDEEITWKHVLTGYINGVFPMGDDENEEKVRWYYTDPRGIISLHPEARGLHITRSLKQIIKKEIFEIKFDTDFESVIRNCADRENTWINKKIIELYTELHKQKFAHSVEVYFDNKLVGGLYGIEFKYAFFGESMFSLHSNASKVAVALLYKLLKGKGFSLFDIQMITPVFNSFGAIEIPFKEYQRMLKSATYIE